MPNDVTDASHTGAVLGRCLKEAASSRLALLSSPRLTDLELLPVDCEIGRVMNAANSYDPKGFEEWLTTFGTEAVISERDAFMRISRLESEAEAFLAARVLPEGPYTVGKLQSLVAALDQSEVETSNDAAATKAKSLIGESPRREKPKVSKKTDKRKKRVTAGIRQKVRDVVYRWRNSENASDLAALLPIAQATQISVADLIRKSWKPGPFQVSLLKAAKGIRI